MRFQPTIDIWALTPDEVAKLQPGQWVTAGGAKGVFCGVKKSGSVVCMWQDNAQGRKSYADYRKMHMKYARDWSARGVRARP